MKGIQYYLRKPLHIVRGHMTFVDAPWALTALTQGQFGASARSRATTATGLGRRLPVRRHLRLGLARDRLRQAREEVHARGGRPRGARADQGAPQRQRRRRAHRRHDRRWHLDPAIAGSGRAARTATTTRCWSTRSPRGEAPPGAHGGPEPLPGRRLRPDRRRPRDDGGRQRVRSRRGQRAARGLRSKAEPVRMFKLLVPEEYAAAKPPTPSSTARASRTRSTIRDGGARGRRRRRWRAAPARSATATALARGGRRVVALDRAHFPSDTLSTHLLFAGGVAELARHGRPRAREETGAPRMHRARRRRRRGDPRRLHADGRGDRLRACVRRAGARRGAGGDRGARPAPRCASAAASPDWCSDGAGRRRALHGTPTVPSASCARRWWWAPTGAGRSSRARSGWSAAALAAQRARACFFAYWEDGAGPRGRRRRAVARRPAARHRVPVRRRPGPRAAHAAARGGDSYRADPHGAYDAAVGRAARPARAPRHEPAGDKVRMARHDSYFLRSAGPGWALPATPGTSRTRSPRRASATRCATGACSARRPRPCSTTPRRSTARCARGRAGASASAWSATAGRTAWPAPTRSARSTSSSTAARAPTASWVARCSTSSPARGGPRRSSRRGGGSRSPPRALAARAG